MMVLYFILGQVGWSKSFFVVDCNCGKHGAHLNVLAVLGAAFDTLEPGVDPHMETLALLVHLLGNTASILHLWLAPWIFPCPSHVYTFWFHCCLQMHCCLLLLWLLAPYTHARAHTQMHMLTALD